MRIHDAAFYAMGAFLVGVLTASVFDAQVVVLIGMAIGMAVACWILGRTTFALIALVSLIGIGLYTFDDASVRDAHIPLDATVSVVGMVEKVETFATAQRITISLGEPYRGRTELTANTFPTYRYGDIVSIEATFTPPPERAKNRLAKNGVSAVAAFPIMTVIGEGGSPIKKALFAIRERSLVALANSMPPEQAAFMSGLVLGETGSFSQELRDQMSITGTAHLVALSGYNVAIIAGAILGIGTLFMSRRKAVFLAALSVVGFVTMTGAEASVVRAAIMGVLILLAGEVKRVYSARNSIAVAAVMMVAANPKVLVFDLGFQLSFAAAIGLIYLQPELARWLRLDGNPGFLRWRATLSDTLAAQIAVTPILLASFGTMAPFSMIPNVLILAFVPITMLIGFVIIGISIVSSYAALVLGWIGTLLIGYEQAVIALCAKLLPNITMPLTPVVAVGIGVIYYGALVCVVIISKRMSREPFAQKQV